MQTCDSIFFFFDYHINTLDIIYGQCGPCSSSHIIIIRKFLLSFVTAILDIAFMWKARYTMEHSQKVKLLVKLVLAIIWTIVLPVCYSNSRRKYTCYSTKYGSLVEEWCFTSYMVAAAIYLTTNAVEVVLFFVPAVAKYIEVSNYKICRVLSWWIQVS